MFNLIELCQHYPEFQRLWRRCFGWLVLFKLISPFLLFPFLSSINQSIGEDAGFVRSVLGWLLSLCLILVYPETIFTSILGSFGDCAWGDMLGIFALLFIPATAIPSLFLAYLIHVADELLFRYRSRKASQ